MGCQMSVSCLIVPFDFNVAIASLLLSRSLSAPSLVYSCVPGILYWLADVLWSPAIAVQLPNSMLAGFHSSINS